MSSTYAVTPLDGPESCRHCGKDTEVGVFNDYTRLVDPFCDDDCLSSEGEAQEQRRYEEFHGGSEPTPAERREMDERALGVRR